MIEQTTDMFYWYKSTVLRIVDGDTLRIFLDYGYRIKQEMDSRLNSVDTPEIYGVKKSSIEFIAGKAASDRVKHLLRPGDKIIIHSSKDKSGKYGRYIIDVYFPAQDTPTDLMLDKTKPYTDLGKLLIDEGHAKRVDYK